MNCPWSFLSPSPFEFCEERLCSWIVEPANTWSNLGFIIIAFYIFSRIKNGKKFKSLNLIAWSALWTGLLSAVFHATGSVIGLKLDFAAMLSLTSFMISFNLIRIWPSLRPQSFLLWFLLLLVSTGFLLAGALANYWREMTAYCVHIAIALILEFICFSRSSSKSRSAYAYYAGLLVTFAIAGAFWLADFTHFICDPQWHFLNGHALWHLINGLSFFWVFCFYKELVLEET